MKRLKSLLKWFVLGTIVVFLGQVLRQNWQEVAAIRIEPTGWAALTIGLGMTLLAHICAAWVWSGLLQRDLQQAVSSTQLIQAYLQTNVAKYLPGNIWHYYGRISAATKAGATIATATVSVLLEPVLMATSALVVAMVSGQAIASQYGWGVIALIWISLLLTLLAIQPRVLNPVLYRLAKAKQQGKSEQESVVPSHLQQYPWIALGGSLAFLLLRGIGFLFVFLAIQSIELAQLPILLSGFSLAWLLGLIVPGAPGGLGVFEATTITLLGHLYTPGTLLAIVAWYRLMSVMAEVLGCGLSWLDQQLNSALNP